jgi:hypothetical protein
MPYKIIYSRKYWVIRFNNEERTNKFLKKNPSWGVIQEVKLIHKEKAIYVARLTDKGIGLMKK